MLSWRIGLWVGLAWLTIGAAAPGFRLRAAEPEQLAARLRTIVSSHPGRVTAGVKNLATGEEFFHDADRVMPTASLIKFPIMATAYRQVDEGRLDLARMLTLRAEDQVQGSGILTQHFSPGARISLRDAIQLMIAYSDNTATNLVLDQIGLRSTAETMEQLGFPETKVHAKVFRGETSAFPERSKQYGLGSTTARDMVTLLERLYQKKLASPESCDAMLAHLLACQDRDKMPRDLPQGVKVAHKTGSVNAVRTDAGIILAPSGALALCVLTAENEDQRWERDNAAELLIGRIARAAYDHFQPDGAEPVSSSQLALGASGTLVESLQRTLNARLSPSPELSADGEFGSLTRVAVIRFQQENRLSPTGEVGPETWRALGALVMGEEVVPVPDLVNGQTQPRELERRATAPPLVTCKAWAIAEARTGVLLWGEQEREPLDIASTTKIMTAYLVLQQAAEDPRTLDEIVTFSRRADQTIGSTSGLRAGEQTSVRELLYGLLLPSGNDAAVALAEHLGGRQPGVSASPDPVEQFVAAMNHRASQIGMRDTHYANPHGLTASGHVSTAADLLQLARAARQLPLFREYVNTRQHGCTVTSVAGYSRNVVWKNTNRLLTLAGYHGVKTGTTDAAGACLVSSAHRDDDELLLVVLGSASSDARYVDSRNLLRWAWTRR